MGCLQYKRNSKDKNEKLKTNKFDDAMEDIMDIKSVQVRGDMLFSETQGKPKDHYNEHEELSRGSLYSIKKVINKLSNCVRSMKEIKKAFIDLQEDEKNFMKEIAILRTLDHPCILKIYEFYQQEKYFYLITEFCENGDLFDKIQQVNGPFHEFTAAGIIYQLLSALYYCNNMNIIHRDIKAESILIESIEHVTIDGKVIEKLNIRLSDFSSARSFNDSKNLTKKVGTSFYIAPEVLKRNYNRKCDVWSIGVLLFILLSGFAPFYGETDKEILQSIEKGEPDFRQEEWRTISKEARSLTENLLKQDTLKRTSIKEALKHPWFKLFPLKENQSLDELNKFYRNIISFKTHSKYFFQQAVIAFMIHNIMKKEDIQEIRNLFLYLDTKGDGRLTYKEITTGFKKCKGYNEKDILKVLKFIDVSKSGAIDFQEFIGACSNKTALLSEDNMKNAFILFAKDETKDYILPSEFKSILGLQSKFNDNTWDEIIKAVDANGDNQIEYDEFKEMMLKFIQDS